MRIYIRGLKEKPKDCTECPLLWAESDDCPLQPEYFKSWEEQYKNCPLEVEYQPNPFDSVVELLRDFDIDDEEVIRDLADYICIMFKHGPYDSTEVKP